LLGLLLQGRSDQTRPTGNAFRLLSIHFFSALSLLPTRGTRWNREKENERKYQPLNIDFRYRDKHQFAGVLTWHAISCFPTGAPLDAERSRACHQLAERFPQMTRAMWSDRSHRLSDTSVRAKGSEPSQARYPPAVSIKPRRELCAIGYLAGT